MSTVGGRLAAGSLRQAGASPSSARLFAARLCACGARVYAARPSLQWRTMGGGPRPRAAAKHANAGVQHRCEPAYRTPRRALAPRPTTVGTCMGLLSGRGPMCRDLDPGRATALTQVRTRAPHPSKESRPGRFSAGSAPRSCCGSSGTAPLRGSWAARRGSRRGRRSRVLSCASWSWTVAPARRSPARCARPGRQPQQTLALGS